MASRPRRSAATKAKEVISVHARLADSPERSTMSSRRASGRASGATQSSHRNMTVKVSNNSLRQSARGGRAFEGGEIVEGKRNRGARKSYVVDSSPEEDEEEEDEIEVEEDDDDEMDEDAEGEEEIDMDAEGEEDAEGDIEMDMAPPPPTIKVSKPAKSKPAPRPSASKVVPDDDDDDDDDEDDDDDLSDPADSDIGDHTMGMDETMVDDEDAEGEEIEVAGEEVDDDDEEEVDSEDEGSQDEVDMTKLTKRQRARFEEEPQQYMKLSDEVQAKKVFTAEELSMRRQEMARRRRNLSEKRTEEVKMETINKLLKKQAPKINRKAAAAAAETVDGFPKPDAVFVRWVSNKNGVRVAVPHEIVQSPAGAIFGGGSGLSSGKMIEEVA